MKEESSESIENVREIKNESEFNLLDFINSPGVVEALNAGKCLFKKEKDDPNMCEISIKAPSEVVLKLFKVEE